MRLFAAVDPSEPAVAHLRAALPPPAGSLRWSDPQQWHCTLAFYGEVPDRRADELAARLARAAARAAPFTLWLGPAGTFPARPARAGVLWCAVAGDVTELSRLAARAAAAGRRVGGPGEHRPLRPHLTLGRVSGRGGDLREPVRALADYQGPPWQVTELRLVRSHLGAAARHESLAVLPLGRRMN